MGRPDEETGGRSPWIVPRRDRFPRYDGGDAVHMARDDMAAEFVPDLEGALQVDAGSGLPVAHGGALQGLGRGIHLEPAAALAGLDLDDGEARPSAGNGSSYRNR